MGTWLLAGAPECCRYNVLLVFLPEAAQFVKAFTSFRFNQDIHSVIIRMRGFVVARRAAATKLGDGNTARRRSDRVV